MTRVPIKRDLTVFTNVDTPIDFSVGRMIKLDASYVLHRFFFKKNRQN